MSEIKPNFGLIVKASVIFIVATMMSGLFLGTFPANADVGDNPCTQTCSPPGNTGNTGTPPTSGVVVPIICNLMSSAGCESTSFGLGELCTPIGGLPLVRPVLTRCVPLQPEHFVRLWNNQPVLEQVNP